MSDTNPTPELPILDMFIFTEVLPSLLEVLVVLRDEVDLEALRLASEERALNAESDVISVAGTEVANVIGRIQQLIAALDQMHEQRDTLLAYVEGEDEA